MQVLQQARSFRAVMSLAGALRVSDWTLNKVDPAGLRFVATISVWLRWMVAAMAVFQLFYRPYYGPVKFGIYAALLAAFVLLNGYVHHRLVSGGIITWRWIFALFAVDIALVSGGILTAGGFSHYFFHILYYPVLAGVAVTFTSFRLSMAWVTVVSVFYLVVSLTVGEGLNIDAREEKPLVARIVVMYALVAIVNLVSSFERTRWREAVERERAAVRRERELQRERIELSRSIHDTMAQSAYMIGLGLDSAKSQAGGTSKELTSTLDATSALSKSLIWQMRQPIDMGSIYEGRELVGTVRTHASTFMAIASIPVEIAQNGSEPSLSTETKSALFSIVHNALANALRHANASRVVIEFDFGEEALRVAVSDDGAGLPENGEDLGHGLANMRNDAKRLGGCLTVESCGGVRVTCVIPSIETEKERCVDG